MKGKVGDVKGDFTIISIDKRWYNIKWLDRLSSCVVSHWDDDLPAIYILYDYDNDGHSHEESLIQSYDSHFKSHNHFKKHINNNVSEGINIFIHNSLHMDDIKVKDGCIVDRFRKQVLDIVKS